ncbi:UNVERIFIED_CONTAM: Pleiotropic drug resistance protein 1 [Sesamum angustifolium]|uniref:Pleiotropic drug resistance protein 1 n=1 Tax=Sesamum angustifolium TaxID=2727405 RepID=A0AAW2LJI1_9LAMI
MAKMDMNDVYRASNGFRRNASAAFRNDVMEIFSSSSRVHEDDDEALKWAVLEKLPTFDRLRKGLLLGSRGAVNEVDIQDLGFQERKQLVERLVKVVEEDNEKFLLKFKNRIDRVGIQLPTIEVRFEHLNVETEVHVGNRALPSFKNFFINILEGFATYLHIIPSRKKHLSILHDVSGILKPGRMTLLLGPPSSGKTTLLLALAGKLDPALKVSGTVTYNGHSMKEFVPERTAAYISQHDVHIGEMTVRETLAFSARCQGVGSSYGLNAGRVVKKRKRSKHKPDPDLDMYMKAAAMEGQETSVVTDYVMKILGLEICADTMVGDQMIRGISGGQRKRVTTGEMLVGPAKALFMDEISTGLDSSTTFQVVNSIRQFVHILNGTATIALLQPEPETFDLFDEIILISEGQIVYQGPRENVLEFFQSMGFKCPERKGLADFLQEVTSKKDQRQYWAHHDKPYRYITVAELAEAFKSFEIGRKLNAELSNPFDKSKSHPAALSTAKYGVSKKELLKACVTRELLLVKRNSFVYLFRIFRWVTDISMTIQKLPVFYKQRDFFFYPAWAYGLPSWIVKIPAQAVEVAGYVAVTYYVIGYDPSVGRLFKHYLLILVELQTASAIFRCIAAVSRNMITANTYGFFVLLIALSMSGFVLSRDDVKKWWLWGYWTSPLMYAENALIVNEFTGHSWRDVLSKDNVSLAVEIVKSRGYFPGAYWYWIGLGALFGMLLLYNAGFILALTYLNRRDDENKNRGIILPFEQHWITFDEIKYSVDMPQMFVEKVMELVELTPVRGGLVGLPGVSGLSAEQRKRLTIAVELVANPSIIFMDEPTSGLDARAAAIVMRTVRNTVDTGRTVVCTIHQPSIDIFEAFDELLLMKRGGQEIYVGPLGPGSCHLIQYFEGIQGVPKIRDGYNPATWMLEVTSSAQEMMLGVDFAELYRNSELYRRNKALINELSTPQPGTKDLHFQTEYSQPFLTQCIACLWKQHWSYWRNPLYSAVRILYTAFLALMFGSMFWDLGSKKDTQQDLINAMGSMYASVFFLGVPARSIGSAGGGC